MVDFVQLLGCPRQAVAMGRCQIKGGPVRKERQQWQHAISNFQQVLGMLNTAEETEGRKMYATCLTSRSRELLRQISDEIGRVHCNISMCHMSLGVASEALAAADAAIDSHPRLAKAHARRAVMLQSLGLPAWAPADAAVF